jgi:predicted AAA+ superfamily ATPase
MTSSPLPVRSAQISSLLVYASIFDDKIGQAWKSLVQLLESDNFENISLELVLSTYGNWFQAIARSGQSWQDWLVDRILGDRNPFSEQLQQKPLSDLPQALIAASKQDLAILQAIYRFPPSILAHQLQEKAELPNLPIIWDLSNQRSNFLNQATDWTTQVAELAEHYQRQGYGIFAQYPAFRWQAGGLNGIAKPDPIQVEQLLGYEDQKQALIQNTEVFLKGYPALNVLLYGSRGSGKSSLVKGLLAQYHGQGLRLVEVNKSEMQALPHILDLLRDLGLKFVIFVDDLSFEEDDEAFKSLKVVLEGSLTAKAQNVIVYATSNRRHLIREFFDERPRPSQGEEVHAWDTMQEKLSFSDRFGLTLTFEPANQATYLNIVQGLAQQAGLNIDIETLDFRAKQWATRHNGRSGRTARQFIDFLQGEIALGMRQ